MGRRALSIQNLIDYTPKTLGFTGRWLDAMGDPELDHLGSQRQW